MILHIHIIQVFITTNSKEYHLHYIQLVVIIWFKIKRIKI